MWRITSEIHRVGLVVADSIFAAYQDSQLVHSIVEESERDKLGLGSERRGSAFSVYLAWFCHKSPIVISFLGESASRTVSPFSEKQCQDNHLALGNRRFWTQCPDGITCICETRSIGITPKPHTVLAGIYPLADSETKNEMNVFGDCAFGGYCRPKPPVSSTVFHVLSLKVLRPCAVLISATSLPVSHALLFVIVPWFLSGGISPFIWLFAFSFARAVC